MLDQDKEELIAPIRAYNKFELRIMYGFPNNPITPPTFSSWMKKIEGELEPYGYHKDDRLLTPRIVQIIFERLGYPVPLEVAIASINGK